jgi:DNA-binding winged helix-turn-helix (wHTH) protein
MERNLTYFFGTFRLDTVTQLLWVDETNITLTPKVYGLLLYFLQHPGRVISHEELFDNVWRGRIVDDSSLRLAINSLRNVLHDESKFPNYILTVYKRGYRFLADVTVNQDYRIYEASKASPLYYRFQIQTFLDEFEYNREVAVLHDVFQRASNGERRLVFLNGEQGVGKTALLDRFLAKIYHPELGVLRARCVHLLGDVEPFLPLLEALERRCGGPCGRLLIEYLNHLAPTWLYQLFNILGHDVIDMLDARVSHLNTGRMLREGANFFEALSTITPFILIVDNTHWSDISTLDLLNFLMFRSSEANLLIIVSYRTCVDSKASMRIEEMRKELFSRGLCHELVIQKS